MEYKDDLIDLAYFCMAMYGDETYEDTVREIERVYREAELYKQNEAKAEAFDRIVKIAETSDNHLDFSDDVDAVIKNYQGDF